MLQPYCRAALHQAVLKLKNKVVQEAHVAAKTSSHQAIFLSVAHLYARSTSCLTSASTSSAVAIEKSDGWAMLPPRKVLPPLLLQATWPSFLLKPSWVTIRRAVRVTCTPWDNNSRESTNLRTALNNRADLRTYAGAAKQRPHITPCFYVSTAVV
jgi:hypothetical protein